MAGIFFTDEKIFLCGYSQHKHKITGIGGKKQNNELPYETALRETLEEIFEFDNIPFDFNKIKKLKNEQYWDYIYKCYTFCLKLYRLVYGIDADISGRNFLRNIFYTFKNDNVKAIFEDENDKPKFINSKGQLSNYTNLKSEITKLSGIRKQIESIIKQENPLKAYIIRKVVEKHKNIKRVGSLNYDIYTPVIKRQAMWHIDYDRTNLKWGSDQLSQSLKNSWL